MPVVRIPSHAHESLRIPSSRAQTASHGSENRACAAPATMGVRGIGELRVARRLPVVIVAKR